MLIGLENFDIDMFLRLDDTGIKIYYSDFETLPQLSKMVPLGSFSAEGELELVTLNIKTRVDIGLEFMHRDLYAEYDPTTMESLIRIDKFLEQFKNIPEVISFFDPYLALCETPNPPNWCTKCQNKLTYYDPNYSTCSVAVPVSEFIKIDPVTQEPDYSDLYFIVVMYFNGIYRTSPENAQEFGTYQLLTDIDFDLNKYSLIINIKEFFTREFVYFLKTAPGSIPFANDYGTEIKNAVQTKNFIIRQLSVESEIQFFILKFNTVYGSLVKLKDINLKSVETDVGRDSWIIEVHAEIQKDRLIYRLIT
jgi:hypothetical protein